MVGKFVGCLSNASGDNNVWNLVGTKILRLFKRQFIQNRTNWCWAVACRLVGERYKGNNCDYLDLHMVDTDEGMRTLKQLDLTENALTYNLDGLRLHVINQKNGLYFIDAWQRAIVMNANMECPGDDGNWPGDDEAKERGIKYVVTGRCESNLIQTATIGEFDSVESLPCRYLEQIRSVFQGNGYMIGNSILYPKRICHSFVLMDWTSDDKILLYDPWNGMFGFYPSEDVFCGGISSPLGTGIIKWAQYIMEG